MDFKSNPGSYVNVHVQMRSMTRKQKHFKHDMLTGEAIKHENGGASSRGNAGVNMSNKNDHELYRDAGFVGNPGSKPK